MRLTNCCFLETYKKWSTYGGDKMFVIGVIVIVMFVLFSRDLHEMLHLRRRQNVRNRSIIPVLIKLCQTCVYFVINQTYIKADRIKTSCSNKINEAGVQPVIIIRSMIYVIHRDLKSNNNFTYAWCIQTVTNATTLLTLQSDDVFCRCAYFVTSNEIQSLSHIGEIQLDGTNNEEGIW